MRFTSIRAAITLLVIAACAAAAGASTTPGRAAIANIISAPAPAARPDVKLTLQAAVERPDGTATKRVPAEQAGLIGSGETIFWTLSWENRGDAPAHGFKATSPITPGTTLVTGSIKAPEGTEATFSIDGGKTYARVPTVDERQPDGTVKKVPAAAERYDHIRFETVSPLVAGGRAHATYEVRVR